MHTVHYIHTYLRPYIVKISNFAPRELEPSPKSSEVASWGWVVCAKGVTARGQYCATQILVH